MLRIYTFMLYVQHTVFKIRDLKKKIVHGVAGAAPTRRSRHSARVLRILIAAFHLWNDKLAIVL